MPFWRVGRERRDAARGGSSARDLPPPPDGVPRRGLLGRVAGFLRVDDGDVRAEAGHPPPPPEHAPAWPRGRTGRAGLPQAPSRDEAVARAVSRLLASLGTTAGGVAASLERAGVRARHGDVAGPPLARYLDAVVRADPEVAAVTLEGAVVVVALRGWGRPSVAVPLPRPCADFVRAFGAGCYPALVTGQPGRAAPGHARPRRAGSA